MATHQSAACAVVVDKDESAFTRVEADLKNAERMAFWIARGFAALTLLAMIFLVLF